jgi:signal transduction histidine kinase
MEPFDFFARPSFPKLSLSIQFCAPQPIIIPGIRQAFCELDRFPIMCDTITKSRAALPDGLAEALGTATERIASVVDSARVETVRRTLSALESRFKEHTVELQTQVKQRHEAEARLRELTARVLQARDDESRRIARELHDSAGQYLAAAQMNLSALELDTKSPLSDAQARRVSDCVDLVNCCAAEIRIISYLLHPPLLDEMGLSSAVAHYVGGFAERSGIRVELNISNDFGRLATDTETAMFRIVQQSLSNIYRHSGSATAQIEMNQSPSEVTMKIRDRGCGIPPASLLEFDSGVRLPGVGIAGMRERIRIMKGRFHIASGPDGTTIEIRLPVSQSAA